MFLVRICDTISPMLIDTHCHLDFKDFDRDRDDVLERAKSAGVAKIINVASSIEGTRRSLELAKKYDAVYATLGVHPHDASTVTDKVIEEFRNLATGKSLEHSFSSSSRDDFSIEKSKVVAIGEVGLDYYRNLSPKDEQIAAFKKFIKLASELDLPLILHARESGDEILDILHRYENRKPNTEHRIKGVMHCFSGDAKFLKECLDLGLYVSFTCNLTFKNAKNLREVAKALPVERLLLETDAPFLAPQEFRGKRNEPAYLKYLVDEWAKLLGLSKGDIARITTHNADKLFELGLEETPKIAYEIRDSLYLNITNNCTNTCDFCVRNKTQFVKGHNLKLDREPSADEILKAVGNPKKYSQIVFCGYGEPTTRLDAIKTVAKNLKEQGAKIRIVTNGHGDLINSRPVAKELKGLIDRISVSLNTDTEGAYNKICKPKFGPGTYRRVLDFIKDCTANGIETEVTCLDLSGVDVKKCEKIAKDLGASFRLRKIGIVG